MKNFNFGKVFGLMAAAAAVFTFMVGGCEQINDVLNRIPTTEPAEVEGAEKLAEAFESADVTEIKITDSINGGALELTVPAGDKTIYIPGGKETSIGSLALAKGSHVVIKNADDGTNKSLSAAAGGRLESAAPGVAAAVVSEISYSEWATLVIWNHFTIPDGATFDLVGRVRLIFKSAVVDGTLKADLDDSLLGTAGNEAPAITGKGTVQTSAEAAAKKAEEVDEIKVSAAHTPPATGGITLVSAEADGDAAQSRATTKITLTFNGALPVEPSLDDIGVDNALGGTAGEVALVKVNSITYDYYINPKADFYAAGTLDVQFGDDGGKLGTAPVNGNIQQGVAVVYGPLAPYTVTAISADGDTGTTTAAVTVTFDREVPWLTRSDIKLVDGSTDAVFARGSEMTHEAGTAVYVLPLGTVNQNENNKTLKAKIERTTGGTTLASATGPETAATLHYALISASLQSVSANGSDDEATTTLTLTFDKEIEGLTAENITLDGAAKAGELTHTSGGVYTLPVTVSGNGSKTVTVTVSGPDGYTITAVSCTGTVYGEPVKKEQAEDPFTLPYTGMSAVLSGTNIVGTTTKPSGNWSNTTSGSFYYNRTVTLSPYRIGKYEVTYELWKMVYDWAVSDARGAGVYTFTNQGTKGQQGTSTSEYAGIENDETGYPVARVAWYDAAVWCNALTEMTLGPEHCVYRTNEGAIIRSAGEHDASNPLSNPLNSVVYLDNNREYLYTGYRLPTSAEWEFAARGGDPSDTTNWNYLYAGSDTASDVAVYNDSQTTQTAKVGTKTPNRLGLYDMGGNVWEWVRDSNIGTPDVGTGHTVAVTVKNPEDCGTEPKLASVRRRGGSYRDSDGGAKNTQHGTTNKDTFNSMGLRIARTVGETQ